MTKNYCIYIEGENNNKPYSISARKITEAVKKFNELGIKSKGKRITKKDVFVC